MIEQRLPSWVQSDAACRHAWQHDKVWRQRARRALHEVHVRQLTLQAWRDYAQATGLHRQSTAGQRHHAAECPCAPCRKRRGEKPLPTLKEQQQRRKRAIGAPAGAICYEPGDAEGWLLSAEDRARWTRTHDALRDARDKITTSTRAPGRVLRRGQRGHTAERHAGVRNPDRALVHGLRPPLLRRRPRVDHLL